MTGKNTSQKTIFIILLPDNLAQYFKQRLCRIFFPEKNWEDKFYEAFDFFVQINDQQYIGIALMPAQISIFKKFLRHFCRINLLTYKKCLHGSYTKPDLSNMPAVQFPIFS